MKKKVYLIIILISSLHSCDKKSNKIYHEIERTSSSFNIINWNINADNLPNYYIEEIFDKSGRVIELRFFENGKIGFNQHCFMSGWLMFQYPNENTIIQLNLNENGEPEAELECEIPSKITYNLSKDKELILKVDFEYQTNEDLYGKNGWTEDEVNSLKLQLKEYDKDKRIEFVAPYSMSFMKLNGRFPTTKDFDINIYNFSPLEKLEIEK